MNTPGLPIIVVIDSHADRYVFLAQLTNDGDARVMMLPDARAALRLSQTPYYLVWFVDSRLPDMRGIDCIEMLVQLYPHSRYYLIADEYDADEERLCFRFRHVKYVCRPLDVQWLSRSLKFLVTRRAGDDDGTPSEPRRVASRSATTNAQRHREPP